MNLAYVRVSTVEQNEERQVENLKKYGIDKWFIEKVSGKDIKRFQLKSLLDFARESDTIYIHDFSRIARSTKDLLEITELLHNKQVNLISDKENIDMSTATGKLMLTLIGAINEFERTNLLERQKEGILLALKKGKYKGRKKMKLPDDFDNYYDKYKKREINKKEMADKLHISRPTLNKFIKEYLDKVNKY